MGAIAVVSVKQDGVIVSARCCSLAAMGPGENSLSTTLRRAQSCAAAAPGSPSTGTVVNMMQRWNVCVNML